MTAVCTGQAAVAVSGAALAFWLAFPAPGQAKRAPERPRLVLQITVDQLRGDLLARQLDGFGEGGFRWLLERGTVYGDAHHAHANTETIVGHTTLATGAHPASHGMVGNVWFDRESDAKTYNIEDARYRLLTEGAEVDPDMEIDPTQKAAKTEGRSPAAILVSTFGDELALHTGGRAKIFAVSVKDRGAVSMAGHAGKAFWFSKSAAAFVTSNYYYAAYPEWVAAFNRARPALRYAGRAWQLLREPASYRFGAADDQPWEEALPGWGRSFPHAFGPADGKLFSTLLTLSPAGDELTVEFAKALIANEALGRDDVPDYLGVSLSSTDYIGHLFGPSSLEAEDNLLRVDRALADLLASVDEQVGLERTLVVLCADHGSPEVPGYLQSFGIPAGYVQPEGWHQAPAIAALARRLGVGRELIQGYAHPYLYLDHDLIARKRLDLAEVERALAHELMKLPRVALAVSSSALRAGGLPETPLHRAVLNNFHPKRSGDIYVVFEPNWFVNDFDGLTVATTHGSPWRYDTYVPLVFAGPGVPAQRVARRVYTVDVAPTLAALLGIGPPSAADGVPLVEVFTGRRGR
jgi:predicted AlkP superfamily pyrophosphatase or phosphodiesterase